MKQIFFKDDFDQECWEVNLNVIKRRSEDNSMYFQRNSWDEKRTKVITMKLQPPQLYSLHHSQKDVTACVTVRTPYNQL